MDDYTQHNVEIRVPSLVGYQVEEASEITEKAKLQIIVNDSIFAAGKAPGEIIKQDPRERSKVKEGRKIYITVNTVNPPMVVLPDFINMSVRAVKEELEVLGLIHDSNEPVPYVVANAVRGVKLNGQLLNPGDSIVKGSRVDLLVSIGQRSNQKVPVPNLFGMTQEEARGLLVEHSLNIGHVTIDTSVKDTMSARVYIQRPLDTLEGNIQNKVRIGDIVDVWITADSTLFYSIDSVDVDSSIKPREGKVNE